MSYIYGTSGNDTRTGTADYYDYFYGSAGHDTITGDVSGYDSLYFYFNNSSSPGVTTTGATRTITITNTAVSDSAGQIDSTISNIDFVYLWSSSGFATSSTTINASAFTGSNGFQLYDSLGTENLTVLGSSGTDYIYVGRGVHTLDGGAGNNDYLNYGFYGSMTITEAAGVLSFTTAAGTSTAVNFENISAGVIGGAGTLDASAVGHAMTFSAAYDQTIIGGSGADRFNNTYSGGSALGASTFTGGAGADTYYYSGFGANFDNDHITDFALDDLIDLSGVYAYINSEYTSNVAHFLGTAAFTGQANEVRYVKSGATTLIQVDADGNGVADSTLTITNGAFDLKETTAGSNKIQIAPKFFTQTGGAGNDTLNGKAYTFDTLIGLGGSDTLNGLEGDDTLDGGAGDDTLNGGTGNDSLNGAAGDDTLNGGTGNDKLFGGSGVNRFDGGDGYDFAQINLVDESRNIILDTALAASAGGTTLIDGTQIRNVENFNLTTGSGDDQLVLTFGQRANLWDGGIGNDRLVMDFSTSTSRVSSFQYTADVYEVDYYAAGVFSTLDLTNVEAVTIKGSSLSDSLTGLIGNDTLIGNGGSDSLYGSDGSDTLDGGAGNDYLSGGNDRDTLTGGGDSDTLDGGGDADTMFGGVGDDYYYVNNAGDKVREDTVAGVDDGGYDTVYASVNWILSNFVENLYLTGAAAVGRGNASDNYIQGTSLANALYGMNGNDSLNGLGGADKMFGGVGNDSYYVDDIGDLVREDTVAGVDDGGQDRVFSNINYTLTAFVEDLVLTNLAAFNGTGNGGANGIYGNSNGNVLSGLGGVDTLTGYGGSDYLDGGTGIDTMFGGAGNDTYIVDSTSDVVREDTTLGVDDTGVDKVIASVNWTLGAFTENLTLTGAATTGKGNALDNTIMGNASANGLSGFGGNDTLDGQAGADKMLGGDGNDTYYVDNTGDLAREYTVAGVDDGGTDDLVVSSVTFALDQFVEDLTLVGANAIDGKGNALANTLIGNSNANVLTGGTGDDTLTGAAGADTFVFGKYGATNGLDHITDFATGVDHLSFRRSDYGLTAAFTLTSLPGTASSASAQFVYDTVSHTLYWDANGNAVGGMTALAIFDNGASLAVGDFVFT